MQYNEKTSRDKRDSVRFARMKESDIPQVHALEQLCFPTPWEIAAYYRDLHNPFAFYLVAKHDARIAGFGGMWIVEGEAHIVTLAVHPESRRRGIARKLVDGLLAEARRRGAVTVTLEVRVGNIAALHLYNAIGFRTVALRRNYYTDNNEDAAVMAMAL